MLDQYYQFEDKCHNPYWLINSMHISQRNNRKFKLKMTNTGHKTHELSMNNANNERNTRKSITMMKFHYMSTELKVQERETQSKTTINGQNNILFQIIICGVHTDYEIDKYRYVRDVSWFTLALAALILTLQEFQ